MVSEVIVYDLEWQCIQQQDWPPIGSVFVCRDPQRRTGPECWNVAIMGNGTLESDTVQLGLFWHREDAVLFAEAKQRTLQSSVENFNDLTTKVKSSADATATQIAKLYSELLLAVEQKCEGESRHDTALRIIRSSQSNSDCGRQLLLT